MNVCVYAICKNEAKHVDRFMSTAIEADMVVVLDTGSKDGTVKKLRKMGARVFEHPMKDFRFDAARNEALRHVPHDMDVCVSADLDEMIQPGWRKALEAAWTPETTRGQYLFNWSFNADGSPQLQFVQDRIHARGGYYWKYACHEQAISDGPEVVTFLPGVVFDHLPDWSKDRTPNLRLMELDVKENPVDPKPLHYLGREYMNAGMFVEAASTLLAYLGVSEKREERSLSRQYIARCLNGMGDAEGAYSMCYSAIAEAPHIREPYVEFAQIALTREDWEAVRYMCLKALSITERHLGFNGDPNAWNDGPDDMMAAACGHLGRLAEGFPHAKKAVEINPTDGRLIGNLKWYIEHLKGGDQNGNKEPEAASA